ncbi:MAG: RNA 2',3'-cyclic phosphodiesterase [Oscillospiraceae bacterium]|nr:RNA 2',3'-cyclic phosphodiesterase [Oscillospiraceae bacterium]
MRLFLAIQLNDEIRNALIDVQSAWKRRGVIGNYTSVENLHLTLAFIGDYPEPYDVLEALDGLDFSPVTLRLEGIGSFGDLWWAGLSDSRGLEAIVRRIRHRLSEAEIPFDRKKFSPHITLIRKASRNSRKDLPPVSLPSSMMEADRISLMRSDRGKNGMIYTEIGGIDAV